MADLTPVDLADGIHRLRRLPDSGNGFLGLEPTTQHDQWMLHRLTQMDAALCVAESGTLLGSAPNPANPRQSQVAVAADDSAALHALLSHLRATADTTSFTATSCSTDTSLPALLDCGFQEVGTLRGHVFRAGVYRDVYLYYAAECDLRHHAPGTRRS
ncbi:hypothetical protein ACMA1D_06395 [Streptomyces sp. 796.1]|uniref:hypothetical protein n=1 Tax=Streptomyces sp. 796.1 TaxID=3163029 RepID=UPI0039C9DCD5